MKSNIKMTPTEALDKLLAKTNKYRRDEPIYPEAAVIREALDDFEWLKSVVDIDFFYRLSVEDRFKLVRILGKTCQS